MKTPHPGPEDGIKIFRTEKSLALDHAHRREFYDSFPRHGLFDLGGCGLDLVRRRESKIFLAEDNRRAAAKRMARMIILHTEGSNLQDIIVSPKRIKYESLNGKGLRVISLVVEDESGVLEEERETYLYHLTRATGVSAPLNDFEPKIEIGKGPARPSLEALEFLKPHIPDQIALSKVKIFPFIEGLWGPRHKTANRWQDSS